MSATKFEINKGIHLLDGATGTALIAAGMPRLSCKEKWILDNPQILIDLQRKYAASGSEIIYAPTFQANELALRSHHIAAEPEDINARLVALSHKAAPDCIITGNVTTLRGYIDTSDESNFPVILSVYRRQILSLTKCGVSMISAETLLHPLEAKAVLTAAIESDVADVLISFALRPDGTLRSGHEAEQVFIEIEKMGATAIGMNCIAADDLLPPLVKRLKRCTSLPLICKPNTGRAINGIPTTDIAMFTEIMWRCIENGASLVGGCCGTTPEHIAALKGIIQ